MSGFYEGSPDVSYTFGVVDFETTKTFAIKGPAGKRGKLLQIHNSVTANFVGTTTPGKIQVGRSGALAEFGELNVGAAGAGTAAGAAVQGAGSLDIPADAAVLVTCAAPVGGSVAGQGHVTVVVRWY